MAGPSCHNCVYSVCDTELLLRLLWAGEPLLPRCANHPQWPGQLREVPGVPCRNYRPKHTVPKGDVRLIPLGDGFYAYVDAADYEWLSQWKWGMCSAGYAARHEKGKYVFMHREIMKPPQGMVVDHIDGSKANNCRFNLRVCTRHENQRNLRKQHRACTRFKGVYYDKRRNKWYARWDSRAERCWLGYFDEEVDAARAHDRAAVAWFGKSVGLNFPEEWPPERRAKVYAEAQAEREALRAKAAEAKRRKGKGRKGKSKEAKGTSQKAKGKGQKRSKSLPVRTKRPGCRERTRPAYDARRATKKPSPKARRTRKTAGS